MAKKITRARRGTRVGWVPLTTKVPKELARRIDHDARDAGRNRADHLLHLLRLVLQYDD